MTSSYQSLEAQSAGGLMMLDCRLVDLVCLLVLYSVKCTDTSKISLPDEKEPMQRSLTVPNPADGSGLTELWLLKVFLLTKSSAENK
jgi:hypothetical protein